MSESAQTGEDSTYCPPWVLHPQVLTAYCSAPVNLELYSSTHLTTRDRDMSLAVTTHPRRFYRVNTPIDGQGHTSQPPDNEASLEAGLTLPTSSSLSLCRGSTSWNLPPPPAP